MIHSRKYFFISMALAFGQLFMWSIVGIAIFFIFHDDWLLYPYEKPVRVNIYDLDKLNGLGRAVFSQFLMVVGALALTTLQSLDREFRWYSYAYGL